MHTTEIDGVPVFWEQGPEPLSAGLCFGVGRRNETFANGGITHLVEHLVLGDLPKSHLDSNGSVSPKMTEFTATGRPEAVAEFLAQVCDRLRELPLDRLAVEARVLAAENERSGGGELGDLLLFRYGAVGFGLVGMIEPAIASLTVDQLREHAARWFVRENAALWLTGPPPEGLRLPLPSGARPPAFRQPVLAREYPLQVRVEGCDPAMSFVIDASFNADLQMCAARLLLERLTDRLRRLGGHSYHVDMHPMHIDTDSTHMAFFADASTKEAPAVLTEMVSVLRQLVADGPTQAELDHDLSGLVEAMADPRMAEETATVAAMRHLDGAEFRSNERTVELLGAVTPDQVRRCLEPALSSLLVLVPEDLPAVLTEIPVIPEGTSDPLQGKVWRRKFRSDAPPGGRLTTSPEGISLNIGGAYELTIRYDACVSVGEVKGDHRHLELIGAHGLTMPLCEQDWKNGKDLLSEVESRLTHIPTYPAMVDRD